MVGSKRQPVMDPAAVAARSDFLPARCPAQQRTADLVAAVERLPRRDTPDDAT
ncbi:MAG: hypothetical protein ACLQJR_27405 [Stellaceae bacterium]